MLSTGHDVILIVEAYVSALQPQQLILADNFILNITTTGILFLNKLSLSLHKSETKPTLVRPPLGGTGFILLCAKTVLILWLSAIQSTKILYCI